MQTKTLLSQLALQRSLVSVCFFHAVCSPPSDFFKSESILVLFGHYSTIVFIYPTSNMTVFLPRIFLLSVSDKHLKYNQPALLTKHWL
jgi:hypothetical protein